MTTAALAVWKVTMRYHVLACDYDGTLASDGRVAQEHVQALERAARTGRKLVLVTGRQLHELIELFPAITLFDIVVAENGGILYSPETHITTVLAAAPPAALIEALAKRQVPLSVGHTLIATWHPHQNTVLEEIRKAGLEMEIIFNRDAVMVLPSGVNKHTGLVAALNSLGLSLHNTVGIGDADNDHVFLAHCECSVAVANAIPSIKEHAHYITQGAEGAGVAEIADMLIENDLAPLQSRLADHRILLGRREDDDSIFDFEPFRTTILITGTSGSGKSTVATSIIERLIAKGYQFCLIDPEGDYECIDNAVLVGSSRYPPNIEEIMQLLQKPSGNVVVNLLGLRLDERPQFFAALLPRLQELRGRTGRPSWIIVDEAHHLLPHDWAHAAQTVPQDLHSAIFITVHPNHMAKAVLKAINMVVAVGKNPRQTIKSFCDVVAVPVPNLSDQHLAPGQIVVWQNNEIPVLLQAALPKSAHHRHLRKYAAGDLRPDQSFYFRGPQAKLNLRAHNLINFISLLEGIDDDSWLYHLRRRDYSRWFKLTIKDPQLADEAARVERDYGLTPAQSREKIKTAILDRYSEPA